MRALLLDLDGTLLDTWHDMGHALNRLRADHALAPLPLADLRPQVSNGARGLIGLGFGCAPEDARFPDLRRQFLAHYRSAIATHTTLFDGCSALLAACRQRGLRWGIVTNKPGDLTQALLAALALPWTPDVLVCGDTLAQRKPHPAQLLHAAAQLGLAAGECVYVGDAEHDIRAGRAAGMRTVCAGWGFFDDTECLETWQADAIAATPQDLLLLLNHWQLHA